MALTIILSTRRRPGRLVRTVEHTLSQVAEKDTRLVICADKDDPGTLTTRERLKDPRITWSVEERPGSVGAKYNRGMKVAPAGVYLVMVDYAPVVTPAFDTRLLEAGRVYPDGYAVILNQLANLSFSQLNAVTHKLAERMGGIYPEDYPYWFVDHHLEEMAQRIGRQVYTEVAFDCSERPGTLEKREPYFWAILFGWLQPERAKLAGEIIDLPDFDETPARKVALKRWWPRIDQWSGAINESLRNEQAINADTENPAYMALRNRAEKLMLARMKAAGVKPQKAA